MKLNKRYTIGIIFFMICNAIQASNRENFPLYVQDKLDLLHHKLGIIDPGNDKLFIAFIGQNNHNFEIRARYGTHQVNQQEHKVFLHPNHFVENNDDAKKILLDIAHHIKSRFQSGTYEHPSFVTNLEIGRMVLLE